MEDNVTYVEGQKKVEANLILEGFVEDKQEQARKDFENLIFICLDEVEQSGPKWDEG